MSDICANFHLFAVKPLIKTFQPFFFFFFFFFFFSFFFKKNFFKEKINLLGGEGGVGIKLGYQVWHLGYQFNTKCRESGQPHKSGLLICSYRVPTSCKLPDLGFRVY
jgi:hypothetical protein